MERHLLPRGLNRVTVFALLLASLALSAQPCAAGDINVWSSFSDFHHRRNSVPDQDQRRVGLPRGGACYCVPTSCLNMVLYIANHGYPNVNPGPGNYSGYSTYYPLTDILDTWGMPQNMDVSPGGDDPNDPDCTLFRGDGGDGECSQLGCGTSFTLAHQTLLDWMGPEADKFTFSGSFLGSFAASTEVLGLHGTTGSIMSMAYGRYEVVGADGMGVPILRRTGGHIVTVNEVFVQGSDKRIFVRDPSQDDGDPFGPSPYATKEYVVTDHYVAVTDDDPPGPILNWTYKNLDGLNEPHGDGKRRFLDSYFAIRPKQGWTFTGTVIDLLPMTPGFDGTLPSNQIPSPGGTIVDCVLDQHQVGHFVVLSAAGAAPAELTHVTQQGEWAGTIAPLTTATPKLALSRLGDLYVLDGATITRYSAETHDVLGDADLSPYGEPEDSEVDELDEVIILCSTSGGGGNVVMLPLDLDTSGPRQAIVLAMPPGTQLTGDLDIAIHPATNNLWIVSADANIANEFIADIPNGQMTLGARIVVTDPTGISFDDGGRMYIAAGGQCMSYVEDPSGLWTFEEVVSTSCGPSIQLERSRTNFVAGIHDSPRWDNTDPTELLEFGTISFDCLADVNRDGTVDVFDLFEQLNRWGPCPIDDDCRGDLDFNSVIDVFDLFELLSGWGDCP